LLKKLNFPKVSAYVNKLKNVTAHMEKRERYEETTGIRSSSMNGPCFPLPKKAVVRAVSSSEGTE